MRNINGQNWKPAIIEMNKRVRKLINVSLKQSATNLQQLKISFRNKGSFIFLDENGKSTKYIIELTKRAKKANPDILLKTFRKYITNIKKDKSSAGKQYWDLFRRKSTEFLNGNALFKIHQATNKQWTKEEKKRFGGQEIMGRNTSRSRQGNKPSDLFETAVGKYIDEVLEGSNKREMFGRFGQAKKEAQLRDAVMREAFTNKQFGNNIINSKAGGRTGERASKAAKYKFEEINETLKENQRKKNKKKLQAGLGIAESVVGSLQNAWERNYR